MKKIRFILSFLFAIGGLFAQTKDLMKLSDAPDVSSSNNNIVYPISYNRALQQWKTVVEVNDWIKNNFSYDMERAKKLAENSLDRGKTTIYLPEQFYEIKKGVCVDLSRFTVETINNMDSSKNAQYLMIEFVPMTIDGKIIRKHWIAMYEDIQGYYLLGDSKRPGYIAGPFEKVDDFIKEYEKFRERKIVSWKVLLDYKKLKKKKTLKEKKD